MTRMILADTSVWIDHLRVGDRVLGDLLEARRVVAHPFVIGELALGNLRNRDQILELLHDLPRAKAADDRELLTFIANEGLYGLGIGYVDAHLLAAARLTGNCTLWTRDKRLAQLASRLGVAEPDGKKDP